MTIFTRSIHFEPDADRVIRRALVLDEILVVDPVNDQLRPSGSYVEPRTVWTPESHPVLFAEIQAATSETALAARIAQKRAANPPGNPNPGNPNPGGGQP